MKTTETPTPARRRSPIFWVPTAYFGMGLPFVVLNMVAVLMYKGLGVSDAKIAFWTSLIMLPWTLKPLWDAKGNRAKGKNGKSFEGKTVLVSGSGNVAIYACEKATQLGAKVVAMSDSNGVIHDANGIDLALVKDIKEVRRGRIKEYLETHPNAEYLEGCAAIWTIPCDIALPCATQNELNKESAETLVKNGCFAVAEGANMPTTPDAIHLLQSKGVLYAPGKASNAGGVACSGLEMSQNSMRYSWTFEEVDDKLKSIMTSIFKTVDETAREFGAEGNYVAGANIAGFVKVAEAMQAQGIV